MKFTAKKALCGVAIMAALVTNASAAQVANYYSELSYDKNEAHGYFSYDASTDTYSINGCGADTWGTFDACTYVYTKVDLDSDFDFMVKLESFGGEDTDGWAKAGMFACEFWDLETETYDDYGNTYTGLLQKLDDAGTGEWGRRISIEGYRNDATATSRANYAMVWRKSTGDSLNDSFSIVSGVAYSYPQYLRMVRKYSEELDTVCTYVSNDAVNWTFIGERIGHKNGSSDPVDWSSSGPFGSKQYSQKYYETTGMETALTVGMFVTSHNSGLNNITAVFSGFQPTTIVAPEATAPTEITLTEGDRLSVDATMTGTAPFNYVLKKGGAIITSGLARENSVSMDFGTAYMSMSGDYELEISNAAGSVTKTTKVTVNPNTSIPAITSLLYNYKTMTIEMAFSQPMTVDSVGNKANYNLTTGGAAVAFNIDARDMGATITGDFVPGNEYTLTVTGIQSAAGEPIVEHDPLTFYCYQPIDVTALVYDNLNYAKFPAPADISQPLPPDNRCPDVFRQAIWNGTAGPVARTETITSLNYNKDAYNQFCMFVSGYIIAPETGDYRFACNGDDQVAFWMNTTGMDTDRSKLSLICQCCQYGGGVGLFNSSSQALEPGETGQQSALISLEANHAYYFELYFFEETGGEVFQIAWSFPSQGPVATIPNNPDGTNGAQYIEGNYFTGLRDPASISFVFDSEPADVKTPAGEKVTLDVVTSFTSNVASDVPTYTWMFNPDPNYTGLDCGWQAIGSTALAGITGFSGQGTASLSISGIQSWYHQGKYRLDANFTGKSYSSREIALEVTTDDVPPYATVSGMNDLNKIIVRYSEEVYGYENPDDYSSSDLQITGGALLDPEKYGYGVLLYTAQMEPGKEYTINVPEYVSDTAGNMIKSSKVKFQAPVWSPGFVFLESFQDASTYDALFETAAWDPAFGSGYNADPQVSNYIEITTGTFNKDNCVERVTGYICPAETAEYEFSGAVDDDYKLWVGKADAPASELTDDDLVSWEQGWSSGGIHNYGQDGLADGSVRDWKAVKLEAGKRYFFMAALREGTGGDFVSLTWRKVGEAWQPNGLMPILTGSELGMYADPAGAEVEITKQPEDATVLAGTTVSFSVEATGANRYNAALAYQWYANGKLLKGANKASYSFTAYPELAGEVYCEVSVPGKVVCTRAAVLTVNEEVNPVVPTSVQGYGKNIAISFDREPQAASVVDISNYTVPGAKVLSATATTIAGNFAVELTIDKILNDGLLTVTVKNIKNVSSIPMPAAVDITGGYTHLQLANIGGPNPAGSVNVSVSDITFTAGGTDITSASDSQALLYEEVDGDFDVVVRLEDLTNTQTYTKFGLQFRATLDANSPQVTAVSSPVDSSWNTIEVAARPFPAGSGYGTTWPVADEAGVITLTSPYCNTATIYPHWLRLQRVGDIFACYRSYDGELWQEMHRGDFIGESWTMPAKGYVGVALTSHNQSVAATGVFSSYNGLYNAPVFPPVPDESDFIGTAIGTADNTGLYDYDATIGQYTILAGGTDVWGAMDNAYILYQLAPEGDFTFTAKVDSFYGINGWAKAGIMVREGDSEGALPGDARQITGHVQPQHKGSNAYARACWRPQVAVGMTDDYASQCTEPATFPGWLRLVRAGNVYSTYFSADGENWILFSETDTGNAEPIYKTDEEGNVQVDETTGEPIVKNVPWETPLGSELPLYVALFTSPNSSGNRTAVAKFSEVTLVQGTPEPPTPTEMVLNYAVEDGNLVLSWSASYGDAALEVADSINGEWTTLPPAELVGGAFQMVIPMSEVSSGSFYRLSK